MQIRTSNWVSSTWCHFQFPKHFGSPAQKLFFIIFTKNPVVNLLASPIIPLQKIIQPIWFPGSVEKSSLKSAHFSCVGAAGCQDGDEPVLNFKVLSFIGEIFVGFVGRLFFYKWTIFPKLLLINGYERLLIAWFWYALNPMMNGIPFGRLSNGSHGHLVPLAR